MTGVCCWGVGWRGVGEATGLALALFKPPALKGPGVSLLP